VKKKEGNSFFKKAKTASHPSKKHSFVFKGKKKQTLKVQDCVLFLFFYNSLPPILFKETTTATKNLTVN
jgi:hypothetical protein